MAASPVYVGLRPGTGRWFRPLAWFADVDGTYGPDSRVRLPFSVATLERGMVALEAILGGGHPEVMQAKMSLAVLFADLGELDTAIAVQHEVLGTAQRTLEPDSMTSLAASANLASMLLNAGDVESAERMQTQVLEQFVERLGWGHPETLNAGASLAVILFNLGRYEEALDLEQRVWAARAETLGEEHPDTLSAAANLGRTLTSLERLEDARLALSAALKGFQSLAKTEPRFAPTLAVTSAWLASVTVQMGSTAEGLELVNHGIALLAEPAEQQPNRFLEDLAGMMRLRSSLLEATDQHDEALNALRDAIKIERSLAKAAPAQHQGRLAAWLAEEAEALDRLDRGDEAKSAREEAAILRNEHDAT